MKVIIFIIILIPNLIFCQNNLVGNIKSDSILNHLPENTRIDSIVSRLVKKCKNNIKTKELYMQAVYDTIIKKLNSSGPPGKMQEIDERIMKLQAKYSEMVKKLDSIFLKIEHKINLYKKIEIEKAALKFSNDNGFLFIIDEKKCFYSSKSKNVTFQILEILKNRHPSVIEDNLKKLNNIFEDEVNQILEKH